MYWAFDGFFDLNTEVNFCLKEVLELVEKTEEEEEGEEGLEPEGITVGWVCGKVAVIVLEGGGYRGGFECCGAYIRTTQPKPTVQGITPVALCALVGLTHLPFLAQRG